MSDHDHDHDDDAATRARLAANTEATDAATALARLMTDIDAARARLASVDRQLENARVRLDANAAERLLEANAQLVVAALRERDAADTARGELDDLTEASGRDALTGLPTRARFLDRLDAAIASARRSGQSLAVLFIDLDDFKYVNDTHGHATGDSVLRRVGAKLLESVRGSDTACRFGGDEFALLLTNVSRRADVALVAAKIRASLQMREAVDTGREGAAPTTISASIGIAMYPEDASDAAQLIVHADAAMYEAKRIAHAHPTDAGPR